MINFVTGLIVGGALVAAILIRSRKRLVVTIEKQSALIVYLSENLEKERLRK